MMYKYYGGIERFYDMDYELFVDCLNHAVSKECEVPKLINLIFKKMSNQDIPNFNKNMRSANDILKDYGLEV